MHYFNSVDFEKQHVHIIIYDANRLLFLSTKIFDFYPLGEHVLYRYLLVFNI